MNMSYSVILAFNITFLNSSVSVKVFINLNLTLRVNVVSVSHLLVP